MSIGLVYKPAGWEEPKEEGKNHARDKILRGRGVYIKAAAKLKYLSQIGQWASMHKVVHGNRRARPSPIPLPM